MPRRPRIVVPGVSHHITARGNNREDIFFDDLDRVVYLDTLADNCERYGLAIEGYALMTNHVHLTAVPENLQSMALAIGRTHCSHACYINRRHGRTGHLFDERHYSCAADPIHRVRTLLYGDRNASRAGIVVDARGYPWSSAAAHCGDTAPHRVLTKMDDWLTAEACAWWREELRRGQDAAAIEAIREHTRTGRPLGSDDFVAHIEKVLNRRVRPKPNGRPRKNP